MQTRTLIISIFFLFFSIQCDANEEIWLLVDTQKLVLDVKLGDITLVRFENISIGRNGAGFKRKRGDDTTPKGEYKISWFNFKSRYNIFYGFNYPSRDNARTALNEGLINQTTFKRIVKAHDNNQVPPQNTPLGGMIGIHGLGKADKKIHETMNWTHGCIALTNEQISKLDKWIEKDTIVVVK